MRKSWKHGTTYGYSFKKCRCELCVRAHAAASYKYYHSDRGKAIYLKYFHDHSERLKQLALGYRKKLKHEVLSIYGGNPPKCACCGETIIEFLTIDHILGGGTKEGKKYHRFGTTFYKWLKKNHFPLGYRVLCMNCNFALGAYGYCPHNH